MRFTRVRRATLGCCLAFAALTVTVPAAGAAPRQTDSGSCNHIVARDGDVLTFANGRTETINSDSPLRAGDCLPDGDGID